MNLIFVKHRLATKECKTYLFEVPEFITLSKGEYVQVSTKNGFSFGECVSDAFPVGSESAVEQIVKKSGASLPLQRVVGKCNIDYFDDVWACQDAVECDER